jgi:Fic family protein
MFSPDSPFNLPDLPPKDSLEGLYSKDNSKLLIKASRALADLNGTCRAIPNPAVLNNIPALQESVASSEIEGIHTTIESALENQVIAIPEQDPASKEALRYRDAIVTGLASQQKYALSTRTILAIHNELMPSAGGRFRDKQNQIKKGRQVVYTPPTPNKVEPLIQNWEKFVHDEKSDLDPLIKMAIAHYQFEAIHPFTDGNGRTGRILMVLQLVNEGLLDLPVLYLSGYLNKNRDEYYRLLNEVTKKKAWLEFITFMLTAVCEQGKVTQNVIFRIMIEHKNLKNRLREEFSSIYTPDLLEHVFQYPVTYPTFMADRLKITYQTASKHLNALHEAKILARRKSGRQTLYYNIGLIACLKT